MGKTFILAAVLSFAAFGLQACFYQSNPTGQSASAPAGCAQGTNCQSTTTRRSWGSFSSRLLKKQVCERIPFAAPIFDER